jgi:hypothetical protein
MAEVVRRYEVGEVLTELVVSVAVVAADRRFHDCSVHPLDLTIGPPMVGLSHAALHAAGFIMEAQRRQG